MGTRGGQKGNGARIEGEEGENREETGQNAPKRSEGKIANIALSILFSYIRRRKRNDEIKR